MAKKQTKADKAFIKKISSITVGTGAGSKKPVTCPDCGGAVVGIVGFPIYAGALKAEIRRRAKQAQAKASDDESSFAA